MFESEELPGNNSEATSSVVKQKLKRMEDEVLGDQQYIKYNLMDDVRKASKILSTEHGSKLILTGFDTALALANSSAATSKKVYLLSLLDWESRYLMKMDLDRGIKHLSYVIEDDVDSDIESLFSEGVQFISDGLYDKGAIVIVHCIMGISRSSSMIIAYLMSSYKLRYQEALKKVKAVRSIVKPNDGFVKQLTSLEKELFPEESGDGSNSRDSSDSEDSSVMDNQEDSSYDSMDRSQDGDMNKS